MTNRMASLALVLAFSSAASAEPCTARTEQKKVGADARLILRNEECPDADRRVVKVLLQRNSQSSRLLLRKTQRLSDAPFGGGRLVDLSGDGVLALDITGACSQPNCEHDIYRLSEDFESMYHYYTGGYSSLSHVGHFMIAESYGSYTSWEYLAYDLTATQTYPVGKVFQYSVYVEATESKPTGEVLKSRCTISTLDAKNRLVIADSPPKELLKYCENYGKNYVLSKARAQKK